MRIKRARRSAFTLIELLVVIAIIAILVALLLPAVQQVREAARKSQCQDHLHNLVIAMHSYEGSFKVYPYASTFSDASGADETNLRANKHGWFEMILPYIEQKPFYDQINFSISIDSGTNLTLITKAQFDLAACPSNSYADTLKRIDGGNWADSGGQEVQGSMYRPVGGTMWTGQTKDCLAPVTFCSNNQGGVNGGWTLPHRNNAAVRGMFARGVTRFGPASVPDGTSNVFFLGEHKPHFNPFGSLWAYNVPMSTFFLKLNSSFLKTQELNKTGGSWPDSTGHSSYHAGGAQFVMGDGKVTFISENIDYQAYCYMGDRDDGNPVRVP
ncbi:MAG: DUF1559 domain-containing protein [Planctomycetaceae bacterium]